MTVVLFPGKFQPPHLGHVLTITNLLQKYDKVIVCITGDTPRIMSSKNVKKIFSKVFWYAQVDFFILKGALINWTGPLPNFDYLITGNEEVLKWAKKRNYRTKKVPRSKGLGYSGTELRNLWKKKVQ